MDIYEELFTTIEKRKDNILEVLDWIWNHAELGYKEWNTHRYLKTKFEELGYQVHEVGSIPGFYVDIDTGREGPCVGVFGELDALYIPDHPQCNKENGAVHACGHHTQCASIYGVGIGLNNQEILSKLCGKIRLFAVPCEELVSGEFYENLKKEGVIKFYGGKKEFIRRGLLKDVDMAIMIHGGRKGFSLNKGCNGSITKKYIFTGESRHVAGAFDANNTVYSASLGMMAGNALRERFVDKYIQRYYANITKSGDAPGNTPGITVVDCGLRALTLDKLLQMNEDFDRAYIGAAISMGCKLDIQTEIGYLPRIEDKNLQNIFLDVAKKLFKDEDIHTNLEPAAGCTDLGDVSSIIPCCHAFIGDGGPAGHTNKFVVTDKYARGVLAAKTQGGVILQLLMNGGEMAKKVKKEYQPSFKSTEEYIDFITNMNKACEAVRYSEKNIIIK